ncbi:MAG: hypothetical protein WCL28_02685 [bacterium]
MELAITTFASVTIIWSFALTAVTLSGQVNALASLGYTSKMFDCPDLAEELLNFHFSQINFAGEKQHCISPSINTPSPNEESLGHKYLIKLVHRSRSILKP